MFGRARMGKGGYRAYCPIQLDHMATHALVDSGNSVGNAISWTFAQQLGLAKEDLEPDPRLPEVKTAKNDSKMKVLGRPRKKLYLRLGGLPSKFAVKPLVVDGLSMAFNMSGPFMAKYSIDQLHSSQSLRVQGKTIPLVRVNKPEQDQAVNNIEPLHSPVYVDGEVTVPAGAAVFLPLRVPGVQAGQVAPGPGLVEPHSHFVEHTDTHPSMAALNHPGQDGRVWASVLNTTEQDITVPDGLRFGQFTKDPSLGSRTHGKPAKPKDGKDVKGRDQAWYREKFGLDQSPFLKKPEDLKAAVDLLQEFGDLFSDNDEYGHTDLVEHAIHTTEGPPIKSRHRPINPALEPELKEQVDHWLKQDVIEPSNSPWSFPLLAVPKKNGKRRYVIDYRRLNDRTIPDRFPLPNIGDNLSRMANSNIFSGIDGTGAFHVVSVRKQDREKTAFSTPWGLYQFKRMPFGLCNAPATYCRLVQKVLNGIPLSVAIPYLDDTCVHSHDLPGHLQGLRQVLAAHRSAGLTLQPEKCQLFKDKIEYLGHEISKEGIAVPETYTRVVKDWPEPTNVKEVRTFLGKVSYYRRFIPQFSKIAAPLTDLTKLQETDVVQLDQSARDAFNRLKECLQTSPILSYPQFDSKEPFILDTDWSCDPGAIGGVLSQRQGGEEKVIAYGAKKLNTAEKNYSSHKGELLAAIFFIRHWKYYLGHRPFILRTDHEALKWIRNIEEPKGMILRWLETLANHDFKVEFRAGKKHGNADALSRTKHAAELNTEDVLDEGIAQLDEEQEDPAEQNQSPMLKLTPSRRRDLLKQHQETDEVLQRVRQWVESDKWPDKQAVRAMGAAAKAYSALRGQLVLDQDGVLERLASPGMAGGSRRPCVPDSLQAAIMLQCHEEGGHRGEGNTYEKCLRQFYFPGAATCAAMIVKMCAVCQKDKPKPKEQRHTLASSPIGTPFQKWSIDFVGPLPASRTGNCYILTAKDCFTRWTEAFPTENMTALTVVKTLEKELFSRYGLPDQIHTDQGTQFTSTMMKQVYDTLGIQGTTTPAYNPKSNPVERTHRDLGRMLRACVDDHPQDWEDFLPGCLLAMRTTRCASTGFSPFAMVYGREAALPLDLIYGKPWAEPLSAIKHVNELRARLETAYKAAREQQQRAICRARRLYKGNGHFKLGDKVWLFTPKSTSRSRKLTTHWTGPWEIVDVLSPVLFKVISGPWNDVQVTLNAGIDRLRMYKPNPEADHEEHRLRLQDVALADEFLELPADELPTDSDDGWTAPGTVPATAAAAAPDPASAAGDAPTLPGPGPPPAPPPPPPPGTPERMSEGMSEAGEGAESDAEIVSEPGEEVRQAEHEATGHADRGDVSEHERARQEQVSSDVHEFENVSISCDNSPGDADSNKDKTSAAHGDPEKPSGQEMHYQGVTRHVVGSDRGSIKRGSRQNSEYSDVLPFYGFNEADKGDKRATLADCDSPNDPWNQSVGEEELYEYARHARIVDPQEKSEEEQVDDNDPDWEPPTATRARARSSAGAAAGGSSTRHRSRVRDAAKTVKRALSFSSRSRSTVRTAPKKKHQATQALNQSVNASEDSFGTVPHALRDPTGLEPDPWGIGDREELDIKTQHEPEPRPYQFQPLDRPDWPPSEGSSRSPRPLFEPQQASAPPPTPPRPIYGTKRPAPSITSSTTTGRRPPPAKADAPWVTPTARRATASTTEELPLDARARPESSPPGTARTSASPPSSSTSPRSTPCRGRTTKRAPSSISSGVASTKPPARKVPAPGTTDWCHKCSLSASCCSCHALARSSATGGEW